MLDGFSTIKQQKLNDDPALNSVVVSYLDDFNDTYKWSEYASDDFIAKWAYK